MTQRNDNRVTIEDLAKVIKLLRSCDLLRDLKPYRLVANMLQRESNARIAQRDARQKATARRSRRSRNNRTPDDDRHHHKRQAHKG